MHVHKLRPATRQALAVTFVTALACAGALPAYAAQASHPAQTGAGQLRPLTAAVPIDAGTSPAICASPSGYELAFQSYGQLYLTGALHTGFTNLTMAPNTSPSIACLPGGGYADMRWPTSPVPVFSR